MSAPLVLVVSRSASRTQVYREALDQLEVSCLAVSSLQEVPGLTSGIPLNGILLDMPVLVKSTADEKAAVEDALKALPSAYLNIAPATDAIKLMTANGIQGMAANLNEFAALCTAFPARLVLPKLRYTLHLHALLRSFDATVPEEQTFTQNVAPGGCFLFSANPRFSIGQLVEISFVDLDDPTAVTASICWINRWGVRGHQAPGLGVRFERITDSQLNQINGLLRALKPDSEQATDEGP